MRLPFLRSQPAADERATPQPRRAAPAGDELPGVDAARTRARRRLAGALVLLAIGVVGFPILFETQPRPLPVDTPIRVAAGPVTQGPVAAAPATTRTASAAATVVAPAAVPSIQPPVVVEPPSPAPTPRPASATPATAAPASRPAAAPAIASPAASATAPVARVEPPAAQAPLPDAAASAAADRWVVQVGAFTDATLLREARAKVERAGLKTYTQVIESDAGRRTRVRLGPYATREEADAAAARVKRTGLPAAIVKL